MSGVTILGNDQSYSDFKVGDKWAYRIISDVKTDTNSGIIRNGGRSCTLVVKDTINPNRVILETKFSESGGESSYIGDGITIPMPYSYEKTIETVFKNPSDTISFAPFFSIRKDINTSFKRNIVKYKNDTLFMDIHKRQVQVYDSIVFLESYGTLTYYHNTGSVIDSMGLLSFNNEKIDYDSITIIQDNVYIDNFNILPDKEPCNLQITGFDDLIYLNNIGLFEYIYLYDLNGRRIFDMNNPRISDLNRIASGNYIIHFKMPNQKSTSYKASNIYFKKR